MNKNNKYYLFSIDLEDVRDGMPDGERYSDRVVENTESYLEFLDRYNVKCTFFTVGKLAENKPDLIKRIAAEGHELACHSYAHRELDKLTKEQFKEDLTKNIEALYNAGAKEISGFRAPVFSLIPETEWAYDAMESCGIKYSSSILPADNPLYGWKDFGPEKRKVGNIVELPQTLLPLSFFNVPFGGGVYFRMLPAAVLKFAFSNFKKNGKDITGYFHPYDVDLKQEHFMHPGINNSRLFNFLMYYGRGSVFKKLEMVMKMDFKITTYADYLHSDLAIGHHNQSTLGASSAPA